MGRRQTPAEFYGTPERVHVAATQSVNPDYPAFLEKSKARKIAKSTESAAARFVEEGATVVPVVDSLALALSAIQGETSWSALDLATQQEYGFLLVACPKTWDALTIEQKATAAELIANFCPVVGSDIEWSYVSPASGKEYKLYYIPSAGVLRCGCPAKGNCYHLMRFVADVVADLIQEKQETEKVNAGYGRLHDAIVALGESDREAESDHRQEHDCGPTEADLAYEDECTAALAALRSQVLDCPYYAKYLPFDGEDIYSWYERYTEDRNALINVKGDF